MFPDREDQFPGRLSARRASVPLPSASQDEAAALLPDHISQRLMLDSRVVMAPFQHNRLF
jgi:hypothetical protein